MPNRGEVALELVIIVTAMGAAVPDSYFVRAVVLVLLVMLFGALFAVRRTK
jgi:hypothetical protein